MRVELPGHSIKCLRCGRKTQSRGPIIVFEEDTPEPHSYCVWCVRGMLRQLMDEGDTAKVDDVVALTEALQTPAVVEFLTLYAGGKRRVAKPGKIRRALIADEIEMLEGLYGRKLRMMTLSRFGRHECSVCKSFLVGGGAEVVTMQGAAGVEAVTLHLGCARRVAHRKSM